MTDLDNLPDFEPSAPIEELDAAIADVLVPYAQAVVMKPLGLVAELSDQEPLYAAAAGVLVTAVVMRDGPTWRLGTRILAAHLLATALRGVVKQMVDRTRPDAAARKGEYVLREGERHESDFNSFPSGHTAGAVAVAMSVARDRPGARSAAYGIAALSGVAQVLRSRHYVTDVLAGVLIGVVAEEMVDTLISRAEAI